MHVFAKCVNFTAARDLRAAGLYPYFQRIENSEDTEVVIDGHRKIMVGSNNYMGLTHDPRIIEAAKRALDTYGSGNTGSRFLNGNLDLHDQLEDELAAWIAAAKRRKRCTVPSPRISGSPWTSASSACNSTASSIPKVS